MKRPAGLPFLCVVSLLLAGCMVGPNYQRPAVELPATYPGSADATAAADVVVERWWTLFNDPTLNALVEAALADNFDVQRAVARIEETNANLRAVDAAFLPEIDLGAAANRSRSSSAVAVPPPAGTLSIRNDLRLAVSSTFELDFWGRLRRLAEAARAQALGSQYAKDVVTLSLAGLVAQTYFSLRSLDAQIANTRRYARHTRRRILVGQSAAPTPAMHRISTCVKPKARVRISRCN
jgi:multidrug efflux system outer membrane protein